MKKAPNDNDPNFKIDPKTDDVPKSPQTTMAGTSRKRRVRLKRKVKFADPVAHQRIYERPSSPTIKDEHQLFGPKASKTPKPRSGLNDLEPPLSLVAQLDLAAKKMNARPSSKMSNGTDQEQSLKSLTIKTFKSTVSLGKSHINTKESSKASRKELGP